MELIGKIMEIKDKLEELKKVASEDSEVQDKINEFFEVLKSSKKPCKEGGEDSDCPDLMSPCCNAVLKTCMGTLPLKVTCKKCGNSYKLKELLDKDQHIKKDNLPL
ncbi:hypothetical protein N8Z24_00055 [bacterium]|nr:hypothetical protein [bacterium]